MGFFSSRYDVFISFRGSDVPYNFISHLFSALKAQNIKVFTDENLERGEDQITHSILKTIKKSRISVVIFSQHYPNSPWCLDELLEINERRQKKDKTVIPIFYRVDPSDVQEFKGNYGCAIQNYVNDSKFTNKVNKWKNALEEISKLHGYHSDDPLYRPEAKFIEEIVKRISEKVSEAKNGLTAALEQAAGSSIGEYIGTAILS